MPRDPAAAFFGVRFAGARLAPVRDFDFAAMVSNSTKTSIYVQHTPVIGKLVHLLYSPLTILTSRVT
jgi:hypothetical protein